MSMIDVIDSIIITRESDVSTLLAQWSELDPDITVNGTLTSGVAVKLFLYWSDKNGTIDLHTGDYFTFLVPEVFRQEGVTEITDAVITTPSGVVIATYSIYENTNNIKEVKVTFTDFVETHSYISGHMWLLLFVGSVTSPQQKTINFIINGVLEASGVATVNPSQRNNQPCNAKSGFSALGDIYNGHYIFNWTVDFNMDEDTVNGFHIIDKFSFVDVIPEDSPHIFLTDEIRQQLNLLPDKFPRRLGEYKRADEYTPQERYPVFYSQFNGNGSGFWYHEYIPLVNGSSSVAIDGDNGLYVSELVFNEKLFSANLGRVTRPSRIQYCTIATVELAEGALGDTEVVQLIKNAFRASQSSSLPADLNVYRFQSGGQGLTGDCRFSFSKTDDKGVALPGAMFCLYKSTDFSLGADRFVFSDANGIVTFANLPEGTFYFQETDSPYSYIADTKIYKVVLSSTGFEIYYGENFQHRLSDYDNKIINISEFQIQPVSVVLTGTKNLIGQTMSADTFNFIVKDSVDATVASGTNAADGVITFSEMVFDSPGEYVFTVQEVAGSYSAVTYDDSVFTVIVTVTDDGSGNLSALVSYPDGGIVFNNSYESEPASLILTGTKLLTGQTLYADTFNFIVKDSVDATVASGTNAADGVITFSEMVFDSPGEYVFTVQEVAGSYSAVTYDDSVFTVTVTVTDDGSGNLSALASYPDGGIVFNNSYESEPASLILTGTKILTGQTLYADMFSFIIKDSVDATVASGTNAADGVITFSEMVFDSPGEYVFTVQEVVGSYSAITYDDSVFTVTVTVTDDGSGNLSALASYPDGGIVFDNQAYADEPVIIELTGTKILTGRNLEAGMFSFVVKDSNGDVVATGTNASNGMITFTEIKIEMPGVYIYTVEEIEGSKSGIVYDKTKYTVTVTIEYDGDGKLIIYGLYQNDEIVFRNLFKKPCSCYAHSTKCRKSIKGNVIWIDNNNADEMRPQFVEINLIRDGEVYKSITVDSAGDGAFLFCCVPIWKNSGHKYEYRIDEAAVPDGYTKRVDKNDVINTLVP